MNKKIVYTSHLLLRLELREIEKSLPREIYMKSREKYFDTQTGYNVAVGKTFYRDKLREMAVIYEETSDEIRIVTIYPLGLYEKISKIQSGRWRKR